LFSFTYKSKISLIIFASSSTISKFLVLSFFINHKQGLQPLEKNHFLTASKAHSLVFSANKSLSISAIAHKTVKKNFQV
jgi:hypothetical protein